MLGIHSKRSSAAKKRDPPRTLFSRLPASDNEHAMEQVGSVDLLSSGHFPNFSNVQYRVQYFYFPDIRSSEAAEHSRRKSVRKTEDEKEV